MVDPNHIFCEVVQFYPSKRAYLDNETKVRGRIAILMGIQPASICTNVAPRTWYYFTVPIKVDAAKYQKQNKRILRELHQKNTARVDYI